MAQSGLLGNLLGQAQNTQSGGLMGGGIFSQPQTRGQRRSKLLSDAISNAGQNPYARLGASFGGLLGTGSRAAAEATGLVDKPPEVQRNEAIKQVQSEVAERGLDPTANPSEFGDFVAKRFEELGQGELATKTRLQIQQLMPEKDELPAEAQNLEFRAKESGLVKGTPEYKRFMRSGGEMPEQQDSFRPLTKQQKEQFGIPGEKFAQINTGTGRIHTSSGQTINVGGGSDPAIDALGDQFKEDLKRASEAASQATGILQEVDQATDVLMNPDFGTGQVKSAVTGLRGIAEDLGVSIDPALEAAGVENLSDVSDAESFRGFSSNLTTRLAERLPGNLNTQELNLLKDAATNLGKRPKANARALASFRASAELAQDRATALTRAAANGQEAFINEQERQRNLGVERFEKLTSRYTDEIMQERNATPSNDESSGDSSNEGKNQTQFSNLSDEQLRQKSEARNSLSTSELRELAKEWDNRGF